MPNVTISELPTASAVQSADLFVLEQNNVAKKLTGGVLENWLLAMADGHGGIASSSYTAPVAPSLQGTLTLTFADGTSTNIPIYNGAKGDVGATGAQGIQGEKGDPFTYSDFTPEQLAALKGDTGDRGYPGYVWIKYSAINPTSDADMGDIPDEWMGINSGNSSTEPAHYTDYTWYKIKGATGATGATGAKGDTGAYIWISANAPTVTIDVFTTYTFDVMDFARNPSAPSAHPNPGDLILYLGNYYYLSSVMQNDYICMTSYSMGVNGLPAGGSAGQVLSKIDGTDYNCTWVTGGGSSVSPYTSNPAALGTASPGSSANYSRGDHVHPKPSASDIGAVAVAQGSGNAGKFLVVGSDGNVTTVTMTAWQGGNY